MSLRVGRALIVVLVLAVVTAPASTVQARMSPHLAGTLPEPEGRILQAARGAGLTDRLLEIAADTNGHMTVAGLWFIQEHTSEDSLPLIQAYAWESVHAAFTAVPSLDEVDLTCVQPGETSLPFNRMKVVFSAAVSRDEFVRVPVATAEKFAMLPRVWVLRVPDGVTPSPPSSIPFKRLGGVIYHGDLSEHLLAITFDDGPFPIYTTLLLDTLRRIGVKATFFLVGEQVESYPYFAQAIVGSGHEIANHTFHHPNLTRLSAPEVLEEITGAQETIAAITGEVPRYFRPPGGNYNATVLRTVHQLGLVMVFWTVNSADYTGMESQSLEARVLALVSGGGVVLFHQGTDNTLRILPHLTAVLRSRGYAMTSVGTLMGDMHRQSPRPRSAIAIDPPPRSR